MSPTTDRPNVIVVLFDDLGFAQLGPYGSGISTPAIDELARTGARYNRFHVTAICSPSRASLLTGRNHHAVGVGFLVDMPLEDPGYTGKIPASAATLPRHLRDNGYSTFAVGKWHLAPSGERSASGPFGHWPLGQGFERFYGFLNGDANHYTPPLVADNHFIDQPTSPEDGYHFSEDMADQAIRLITDQQNNTPDRPFFLYLPFGAMHAPHQAPPEWIKPYEGAFDDGWEQWREDVFARQVADGIVPEGTTLPPRPEWIPAWDELSPTRRRGLARMQEVFAGFLSHADHQIGRVVEALRRLQIDDNTIILVLSDNGASGEGGLHGTFNEHRFSARVEEDPEELATLVDQWGGHDSYAHYAWGWAWAGNTPLQLWKRYTWLGGTRVPLIVNWPGHVERPELVRDQILHINDIAPTLLEATGTTPATVVDGVEQQRFDGASFLDSLADPDAASPRDLQYFEMLGSRSIIHRQWKATTNHVSRGVLDEERLVPGSRDLSQDRWALFDLSTDFSESHDLADEHPELVEELAALWQLEADVNNVLPIADSLSRVARPTYDRTPHRRFLPGGTNVRDETLPPLFRGFRWLLDVTVPEDGGSGVLLNLGDFNGGFAVWAEQGRLRFSLSRQGDPERIEADTALQPGRRTIVVDFDATSGEISFTNDGSALGSGALGGPFPYVFQHGGAGLTLSHDTGFPVDRATGRATRWTGELHAVELDVPPADAVSLEQAERARLAEALHSE